MAKGGKSVKYVRLDNAGENQKLVARCKSVAWKLPIKFEYTACDTLQKNSLVEVGFSTIGNRGRSMMAAVNIEVQTNFLLLSY